MKRLFLIFALFLCFAQFAQAECIETGASSSSAVSTYYLPGGEPYQVEDACGPGKWNTGPRDPLVQACILHDRLYQAHHDGDNTITEHQADSAFYTAAKQIAGSNLLLRAQAALYFGLVSCFGWLCWNRDNKK